MLQGQIQGIIAGVYVTCVFSARACMPAGARTNLCLCLNTRLNTLQEMGCCQDSEGGVSSHSTLGKRGLIFSKAALNNGVEMGLKVLNFKLRLVY